MTTATLVRRVQGFVISWDEETPSNEFSQVPLEREKNSALLQTTNSADAEICLHAITEISATNVIMCRHMVAL